MKIKVKQLVSIPIRENPLIGPLCKLAENLFTAESERLNKTIGDNDEQKQSYTVKEDGGYKCIHLGCGEFLIKIEEVLEKEKIEISYNESGGKPLNKIKFLDIGSGVGQKVFLAYKVFGLDSYGLELRLPFVQRANEILGFSLFDYRPENKRVFQANALTFDKYNEFDIIYFYCPIARKDLQIQLEQKIAKDCKKGTVLIAFTSNFFPDSEPDNYFCNTMMENMKFLKQSGWEHLGRNYFKKVK